jgi:plasmid maintenance system antidote protein VapI
MAGIIADRIKGLGLTAYRVAKISGVSAVMVQRFLNGERGLTLATADKICKALDLVLAVRPGSTLHIDVVRERWEKEG